VEEGGKGVYETSEEFRISTSPNDQSLSYKCTHGLVRYAWSQVRVYELAGPRNLNTEDKI
jgi:hypothetical protein